MHEIDDELVVPRHRGCVHGQLDQAIRAGMEIAADVADAERSVILDQVTNGVHVRMAVLYLLLGGQDA